MKLAIIALLVVLLVLVEPSMARKRGKVSKNEDNVESIKYSDKADLDAKVESLKKRKPQILDEDLSSVEIQKLKDSEKGLKAKLRKVAAEAGELSHAKAKALHALGANLFKQGRFYDLLQISKEIVEIHETLDGPEAEITGKALGNLAATAYRANKKRDCELAMKRGLHILLKKHTEDSKEVLLHRGKMLSFQIADGETTLGLSYSEYVDQLENEL